MATVINSLSSANLLPAGLTIANNSAGSTPATQPTGQGSDPLANEQIFLRLLVAQLKNQNPDTPSDPMQFVTQLAQFTQLEQSVAMRQDLDAIKQYVNQKSASGTPPAGTPAP
jgi:flagellar basal-body rod modification protein FlgD